MEFLKKNGFAVGLGALAAGALALLWFMVFGKIFGDMATAQADLEKIEGLMKKFSNRASVKILPTEENKAKVAKWEKDFKDAIEAGRDFYVSRRERFEEFESGSADDYGGFKGIYTTAIDAERDAYRKAFVEVPDVPAAPSEEGGEAATPPPPPPSSRDRDKEPKDESPVISRCTKFAAPEDAKRAQKELWIVKEFFAKLTDLKIGGLKTIEFPEREKEREGVLDPNSSSTMEYRWIRTRAVVEMPFLQVEPLLTALFESDRVPFRLEGLEVLRRQETVVLDDFVTKTYEGDAAGKDDLETTPPEPPVMATFELSALNWIGTPAKAQKAGDGEEDEK